MHRHLLSCPLFKFFPCLFQEWSQVSYKEDHTSVYSFDKILSVELVWRCFLVHLKYSFLTFSFIPTYLMVSTFNIHKYLWISFSPSILFLFWFVNFIPSVICHFPLLIMSMAHFLKLNSVPISWQYILFVCIRIFNSFSFFANSLMSSIGN